MVTPEQRRTVVRYVRETAPLPERQVCRYLGIHRALCRYQQRRPERDHELRTHLRELASVHPRWGCPRLYWLVRREGRPDNYKRVERLYRLEGLAVRRRPRKRVAAPRVPLPTPRRPNERWSMDFMRDTLADGRTFRIFTLVDDFTREAPALEVDLSLSAERVVQVPSGSWPRVAALAPSSATMVRSSRVGPWTPGHTIAVWRCSSFVPASPSRMPISKASTAAFGTSA